MAQGEPEAEILLNTIESQTLAVIDRLNRAILMLVTGQPTVSGYSAMVGTLRPSFDQIAQYAPRWGDLIPDAPHIRAELAYLLSQRGPLDRLQTPHLWAALGLDQESVRQIYQSRYGDLPSSERTRPTAAAAPKTEPPSLPWIDASLFQSLQNELQPIYLPSGKALFRQGDPGDSLYLISNGRVKVVVGEGETAKTVAEFGQNALVGEMSLLSGGNRSASVYAIRDSELFRLPKASFERLVEHHPRLMLEVAKVISTRLENATSGKPRADQALSLAVIPAGDGADLGAFCDQLVESLRTHFDCAHLSRAHLDSALGEGIVDAPLGTLRESRLISWLAVQSELYPCLVYSADPTLTEWTKRCIRQADRVLVVGEGRGTPDLNPIERALFEGDSFHPEIRKELVLLHQGGQAPQHTQRWLAHRQVADYHHLDPHNRAHFDRYARFLVVRPLGLVLSGGSVRGFAHIGVLRALREAGIPVDIIGGTSAGSLIGAQAAMGWDDVRMEQENKALFKNVRRLIDLTLPVTSFAAGKGFSSLLKQIFGDHLIEDLWIKYFCVSADLTAAQLRIHRTGLIRRYVRASSAIPAALPPVLDDGHLLVDGGLMNNLPVLPMVEIIKSGTVIAVDVSNPFYTADGAYNYGDPENGDSLPFGKVLRGRVLSRTLVTPSLVGILLRCLEIGTINMESVQIPKVDLYIRPPVDDIGSGDVSSMDKLIQLGYETAHQQLKGWKGRPPA